MTKPKLQALLSQVSPAVSLDLSELTLAPGSAPLFRVGELLAAMHGRGLCCDNLQPGDLVVMFDGGAAIARATAIDFHELDPQRMALNFDALLATYEWQDFRAILAGYARYGYERLDHLQPGFTDALLDVLGVPAARPRPRAAALDVARLLALLQLGFELEPGEGRVSLIHRVGSQPNAAAESPADVHLLLLCCVLLGIDCSAMSRDVDALLSSTPPGLDLARELVLLARNVEATRITAVLPQLRAALNSPLLEEGTKLVDALVDVASFFARATDRPSGPSAPSVSFAQDAVMILQCRGSGGAADEAQLAYMTRALCALSKYPAPLGDEKWPASVESLALASSLLVTYRTFVDAALTVPPQQATGMLWSAAFRGVDLGRCSLRHLHGMLGVLAPATAAQWLRLLPSMVRNYALLLEGLLLAAAREHERAGHSGWLSLFVDRDSGPSHLEQERLWLHEFLSALGDDVSVDLFNTHVAKGERFIASRSRPRAAN